MGSTDATLLREITLVICATIALGPYAAAQSVTRPTIYNVTLAEDTGVLTITGVGFGQQPVVTFDGQPVAVLGGGSETRLEVVAPAALVMTPGSYRLTVVDPVRRVGDSFVVASQGGFVSPSALLGGGPSPAETSGGSSAATRRPALGSTAPTGPASAGGASPMVIENLGFPFLTAIGTLALTNNTTGSHNTASGYQALKANTSGIYNTATGLNALISNTAGRFNTATGAQALFLEQWRLQHRQRCQRAGIQHLSLQQHGHWVSGAPFQHDWGQ